MLFENDLLISLPDSNKRYFLFTYQVVLTLFAWPTWAYLVGGWGGGTLCLFYVSRGWVRLGFPLFLEMNCLGLIYHIQNDSLGLDNYHLARFKHNYAKFPRNRV